MLVENHDGPIDALLYLFGFDILSYQCLKVDFCPHPAEIGSTDLGAESVLGNTHLTRAREVSCRYHNLGLLVQE